MKYLLYIIIFILILFNTYNLGVKSVDITEVIRTDTITKVDTMVIERPIPDTVYIKEIIRDTVYSTDSVLVEVQLPIETKVYTDDSTYSATISGYKAFLEEIKIFPVTTTVYKEKVLEIASKQPLIEFKPTIACGYGILNNKPDIFVGIGVTINY